MRIINKLSLKVSAATLIVVIVYGMAPGQYAFATPSQAAISARISALSGLSAQDIGEIYAVEQRPKITIIAGDINIPIVLEQKIGYLLIKDVTTGAWIRLEIDLAEWNADFVSYFVAHGIEIHKQPLGTIASVTPDQEAAQIASIATIPGQYVAILIYVVMDDGLTAPAVEGVVGAVGSTPYGIDVSTDGDATISVPVRLLPGVAGFKPSLSLEYDSGRGIDRLEQSLPEDTLGHGWRLAGLSQIRRCVVNQSSGSSINLTNSDSLCLEGVPLVLASGTHFAVGATYRTLIESYTKVVVKGTGGELWFEVTLPDGTVREYGSSSRVDQYGGVDYQWSIDKEVSTDGNVIDYTYYSDATKGINYIAAINYANAEVEFEYLSRNDAVPVSIGSASQTQSVFLHTIRVKYNGKKVREYRLLDEVVASRRRLNKIQHCGYDETGTTVSCLAPLEFDWMTPTSTMAGVDILLDGMTDSLNAVHQIDYGTVTGSSHPFLFTERPFGNGVLPANTQLLSGGGALRHVATMLRRDNGLGGFHDTSYAYQNKGVESTKHWGFLGFYAQRIKDEQSGIVTYAQYRMDYPYFGQVARMHQFDGVYPAHTQTLTRSESDYAQQSITHSAGTTILPYISATVDFIYEGTTQLGASRTTNALTFASGFVSQIVSTTETGTGVSTGSSGSTWGDIPTYSLSGLLNTTKSTVAFTNRTASGQWLINFANTVTNESWPDVASGNGIVRDVSLSPHVSSLRPTTITQFPNDPFLTLSTAFVYDAYGRTTSTTVTGDNVFSRTTSIPSFVDGRYPAEITNAKFQTTTFSAYDSRFGMVKTTGDVNGRNTTRVRDSFGRVTSSTNGDGVVTTTSYIDCPTGCGLLVYCVSPSYYMQTDSVVTPIRRAYFDSLDRVIYTETESFSGTTYSKQNIKYDTQGRIEKTSLPHFSGTSKDVIPSYDIRNRITNIARPDGSSTNTAYTVNGSKVIGTITDNVKKANGTSAGTQVKRNEYNVLGQLTKTTDGYGTSTNPSTSYTYDANGNVLTAIVNGGAAGSTTTTYEYDAAGNQTKIIGPDIGTVTSTYTGLNETKTRTDNKGQLSTYTYDVMGQLQSLANADGTNSWSWGHATNGAGKIGSRSSPGFIETFYYDTNSRLETVLTHITPIGSSGGIYYTTNHHYDTYGRPLGTTYPDAINPSGVTLTRAYNSRGYLSQLKVGDTAIQTINDVDAFGNSVDESYANGVDTLRTFDPETGRLTDVNTTKGSTVFQNNDYAWRSNGTLESRIANPAYGLTTTRKESYVYDVLNRVTMAETYIDGGNTRDLNYSYNQLGNITSKTSTLTGDTDVTGYAYGTGAAGPHAVTSATINGTGHTLTYDLNGALTKYDIAGTTDDKNIAYNAFNQPTKIVIGSSLTDTTPVAKDEFAYDPNGQRYNRKTAWQEGGSTITEDVRYIGAVEIIYDNSVAGLNIVTKTRLSPNVMHVKIRGTVTESFFEYAHRDHSGSVEVVTDENGNKLDNLAFEPFGSRKKKDWTGNISTAELDVLLELDLGHPRKARGFTGHEHLDRTGFIHMNGRVYDPVLGRFLSPDPFVQFPAFSQSWNRYSYVNNAPTSFTDPTGFMMDEIIVRGGATYPSHLFQHVDIPDISGWRFGSGRNSEFDQLRDEELSPIEENIDSEIDGDDNACGRTAVTCRATVSGSFTSTHVTFFASRGIGGSPSLATGFIAVAASWDKVARFIALRAGAGLSAGVSSLLEDLGKIEPLSESISSALVDRAEVQIAPEQIEELNIAYNLLVGGSGMIASGVIMGASGVVAPFFGGGFFLFSAYAFGSGLDGLTDNKLSGGLASLFCLADNGCQ